MMGALYFNPFSLENFKIIPLFISNFSYFQFFLNIFEPIP